MKGPKPRVAKQTKGLLTDPVPGIQCKVDPNNFNHFLATIQGPSGTCYEGGIFNLQLLLPEEYPLSPPKVVFDTKIYHPNIDHLGRVFLCILKKDWSPALHIKSVLLSIKNLLSQPILLDAPSNDVYFHWINNKKAAEAKAKEWTQKYCSK